MQTVRNRSLVSTVKGLYNEFTDDTRIAYRVVRMFEVEDIKYAYIVMRYSHYTFKVVISEIINDLSWLKSLSQLDVRNLTFYQYYSPHLLQSRFTLHSILFFDGDNITFKITDLQKNLQRSVSIDELRQDKELYSNFDGLDLLQMGYLCGKATK
ncbi:hypothetical protein JQC92_22020 [Shewanella sp. 202IG2-18]|uniref:hypothetical protein n=1 Tax=Parashewanella hymeniacidonis TaxID=2807618 RepID=UPI0019612A3C|nr:hypothetical protein [Parashewanella hymeniacidonis]MBM7074653.1 hypothetical protein [Parashewanella hymeniacidonis]